MQFANQPESEPHITPVEAAVRSNQDTGLIESSERSNAESKKNIKQTDISIQNSTLTLDGARTGSTAS